MRLGIKYKLFIILMAASLVIIACMLVFMRISFEKGFMRYVDKREMRRLETLCRILEGAYADHGSWDFLKENPTIWRNLRGRVFSHKKGGYSRPYMQHHMKGGRFHPDKAYAPPPGPGRMMMGGRHRDDSGKSCVILLDRGKKTIFGMVGESDAVRLIPVMHGGKPVGWLGLVPSNVITEEDELIFFKKQSRTFLMISVAMVIISIVVAVWTSFYLERPIRGLARGTKKLSSGNYGVRIPVRSGDELGQLSRDFNILAETLEKNEKSRKQWVEDIAHELRTPLTLLSGELEAVQDGVRELTPETLSLLQGDIARLIRIVTDLNELSKTDPGALSYKKEPIDLVKVIQHVLDRFKDSFDEAGITLDYHTGDKSPLRMVGDPERMEQLMVNIVENALHYTDNGGHVKLWIDKDPGHIVINSQDSAPGVPSESLPKLFDRLYRIEPSRNRNLGGMGIGLAVCKNIAEAHGGEISASPSPAGGLWIQVRIPVV